jgi:hypothetical protein
MRIVEAVPGSIKITAMAESQLDRVRAGSRNDGIV